VDGPQKQLLTPSETLRVVERHFLQGRALPMTAYIPRGAPGLVTQCRTALTGQFSLRVPWGVGGEDAGPVAQFDISFCLPLVLSTPSIGIVPVCVLCLLLHTRLSLSLIPENAERLQ
jgi:hypothetical protein